MPIFPINRGSCLVYGSNNAGRTVLNKDPNFDALMKLAGRKLNLAEHKVGGVRLSTAGDVEAHRVGRGESAKYYLLDLHRWAPPESPLDTEHLPAMNNSVFYRMLRPEFLKFTCKRYEIPALSSDTFSGW